MGFTIETGVSAAAVFIQGLLSFFSPCVLPLVPLYFGYLAGGVGMDEEGGRLKYFMRNHDKRHSTAVAYSDNGGESWHDYRLDDDLPQPICQMSVIKLRGTEKPSVVFINPADRNKRRNGTVRLSEDDGETFAWARQLKDGEFVYSAAAQMSNGEIGVLFEPDTACREIKFVSFSVDWIKGKEAD